MKINAIRVISEFAYNKTTFDGLCKKFSSEITEKVREISTTSFLCAWRHIHVYLKCERVDVTAAEHAAEHFVACDRGRY